MKSKESSATNEVGELLLVKQVSCNKISGRAQGMLHYRILRAVETGAVYVAITGNDSAGYFSRELVPVLVIEQCLASLLRIGKPFPSSKLKSAFTGRSSNNASFLAAILRNEGLLAAVKDSESLSIGKDDLTTWHGRMQSAEGTPLPAPAGQAKEAPPPSEATVPEKKPRGGKAHKERAAVTDESAKGQVEVAGADHQDGG